MSTTRRSLPSLFDLSGRTAVVVGAGSGLGQASAIGLADAGAHVIAADLNLSGADDTASLIAGRGAGSAQPAEVDITDTASVEALVTAWAEAEVLVVTPGANVRKRLVSTSDDEFDRVIDLNLKGTYRLMRGFGREMAAGVAARSSPTPRSGPWRSSPGRDSTRRPRPESCS
jgi:NAD(P)-dependent dehydrogenase (short-subunit alcohol dehydrogenase family)